MDRFVVLVDAGYLYAAAGALCCGTTKRAKLHLDGEKLVRTLVDLGEKDSGQTHLRTYWYDGAPNAVPTREHQAIGALQGVKLRLGRLTKNGQKGVDSRIVRDLIVLSRNGAAQSIFLLSGDEDVREGVAEAQELGVSVALVGIEPVGGGHNQARTLVDEADDVMVLSRTECSRFIRQIDPTPPLDEGVPIEEATDGEVWGVEYGKAYAGNLGAGEIAKLLDSKPKIPHHVDGGLVKAAGKKFGAQLDEPMRRAIRRGFWQGFSEVTGQEPAAPTEPQSPSD